MNRFDEKKSSHVFRVLKIIAMLFFCGILEVGIAFLFKFLLLTAQTGGLENEFLMLYIAIMQVVQLVFGLSKITKTLYFQNDKELLRLPISGIKLFSSKIIFLFIYELIFAFLFGLPALIVFGIQIGSGAAFYSCLPLSIVAIAVIPFCLSLLLSALIKKIIKFLSNKFKILFVFYLIAIVFAFILYIKILQAFVGLLDSGGVSSFLSAEKIVGIKNVFHYFYLQVLIKNILIGVNFVPSLISYLAIAIILLVCVIWFAKHFYFKALLDSVQGKTTAFKKVTKIKHKSPQKALFHKEFLTIFRSPNYSFQYLTVVCATPIMVYFCNLIATSVSVGEFGKGIIPGISVLVLIMFLTLGCSFSATSVTREGENLFFTKIIPVSYKNQIKIKFFVHSIVGVASAVVSSLLLAIIPQNIFGGGEKTFFLSIESAAGLAVAISLIVMGSIAASISIDIKKPRHKFLGSGEVVGTNPNINTSLLVGFSIAVILGVCCLVVALLCSLPIFFCVLFGFAIPFFVLEMIFLFRNITKKYSQIEP